MNITILGVTPIGVVLAKYLVEEGHDVHVVDPNSEELSQLLSNVDARALQGNVRDLDTLREANIHNAHLVLAVTHSDTNNIVMALGLHSLAPQAKTAMWVRDGQFTTNPHIWNNPQLNQAQLLTPEKNALKLVMDLLEIPLAFEVISFLDGRIHIAGFRLQDDSPLIGKRLADIDKSQENRTLVVAVERHNQTIVPDGHFVFEARDHIVIPLLEGRELSDSFEFMGLEQSHLRMQKTHFLIGGGGRMAAFLAHALEEKGFIPTIIEKDRQQGVELVKRLPKTRVLHGDVTNPLTLQENIHPETTYIALTNNQEINFMSSVLARRLGATRSITMFDNEGYIALSSFMGIDAAVHPNLTTIGQVLGQLHPNEVVEAHHMLGGKLEAKLIKLDRNAPMVNVELKKAGIPKGVIVAAIKRKNHLLIPDGNTICLADDQLLLISNRQGKIKQKMRQLILPER